MALLIDWLVAKYPLAKKTTLKRMLEQGRVSVNGQPAQKLKQELRAEDQVEVNDHPARPPLPSVAPLQIIHEDEDLIIVHKPAGLLTSTVANEKRPTAVAILRRYLSAKEPRARVGVIHRLDRDASGLLVFSKNHAAFEDLKRQFFDHSVERIYTAVVHGRPDPPQGRVESNLIEWADGSVHSTRAAGKGRRAVTDYQVIESSGDTDAAISILRVTLRTGRKHQIRAHLAELGTPVVGDRVYCDRPANFPLKLAAVHLAITHPRTDQRLTFERPAAFTPRQA